MSNDPWVERSFSDPNLALRCECGWNGIDADIDEWVIQTDRDRIVRQCPKCSAAVPEWGTFHPIDGVVQVARGSLRDALIEEGIATSE